MRLRLRQLVAGVVLALGVLAGSATALAFIAPPVIVAPRTPAPPAPSAPPAGRSGPAPTIGDVQVVSLSPTSATVRWRTSEPAASRIAYGVDRPTLWTTADAHSVQHEALVAGLLFSTTYQLRIEAATANSRTGSFPLTLTTPPLGSTQLTPTRDGALALGSAPFFPIMVWSQCPFRYGTDLALGVDLFMGNSCGSAQQQLDLLAGRALSVVDPAEPAVAGAAGTYLPDEWDTHLPGTLTAAQALQLLPESTTPGPRFLTLTSHFYSHAEPLPQGKGMYPALAAAADVLGFDLYPLQNWCRYDSFGDVFEAQRELVTLAAGKPTFQWIEVRSFDCPGTELDVTPETVRAETWLAIAGGAHAIGYFPNNWSDDVGAALAQIDREIATLTPALVEPAAAASSEPSDQVRVSARIHDGAVYVIAVNGSRAPAAVTIEVPALGDRELTTVAGDPGPVVTRGRFRDAFAPLEVHLYVASPSGP